VKSLLLLLCILVSTITSFGQGEAIFVPPITSAGATTTSSTSAQISSALGATPVSITATTVTAKTAVAGSVNGVYSASNFGFICDGAAHEPGNSTAFAAIKTFASRLTAGQSAVVKFPPGSTCLYATAPTALPTANLTLDFTGVRMKFTGTGPMVDLSVSGSELDGFNIIGGIWQGNSSATYGFWQDSTTGALARSILTPENVQDVSVAGFYLPNYELNLLTNLNVSATLAATTGIAQTTTPQFGAILGDPTVTNGFFANNRIVNLTVEGVGVIGVWCKHCTNQNHFFGTSEGTTSSSGTVGVGIKDYITLNDANSTSNTFSVDMENNAVADADISGVSETFLSTISLGTFNIQGGGGSIIGGEYQSIALSGSREPWTLSSLYYNALQKSGTLTGYSCLGGGDVLTGVWNRVGGAAIAQTLCTPLAPIAGPMFTGFMSSTPNTTTLSMPLVFANGVANQKIDLYLPVSAAFSGQLLVSLTDTYQDAENTGALSKLIALSEIGGTIYGQNTRYVEAMGGIASTYAIDNASWDSTNGRLRVRVSCLIAANCDTSGYLVANVTAFSDSTANIASTAALAQTAVYTTDTTVYPTPIQPAAPATIFSHAGTQLSACASGLVGGEAVVGDATALTPGTAYSVTAGTGSYTVHVQCTSTGSNYAWQTM